MGMLALEASIERERCALRDRQVRSHSVRTDLELNLPPSITLPDGEEIPYGSSAGWHIRDPEQESEIYRKCIRPPPNRTIFPYRSQSTGLLSNSSRDDWSGSVIRCHSMSSRHAAATAVIPKNGQVSMGLAKITMVPCTVSTIETSSKAGRGT